MVKIKNAKIQKIIGVEANAFTGETYHHIMIVIQANRINPEDFRDLMNSGDIEIR